MNLLKPNPTIWKTLLGVLLFSFVHLSVQSQSAAGKVADSQGVPLAFVSLWVKNTNIGATTNAEGKFTIPKIKKGSYELVASSIGYKTTTLPLEIVDDNTVVISVVLQEEATNLDEVQVVGNREWVSESLNKIDVPLKYLPITANSIDKNMLMQRGVDNLGDAVKSTPGVRPINRYGGFQTFRIRGFNNFVLLVDGVRDERHTISTSAPSTNLANVSRIEVLKGPASVLFGHSALGGVINIVRNQPTDQFEANFSASYGSFDTKRMRAGAGGPLTDRWSYRVDFGMSETEGYRDFGTSTNNFYTAFRYKSEKNDVLDIRVGLNKDHYDTDTGIPVLSDGSLVPSMDRDTRYNDPQDFLNNTRYDFQVRYTKEINENLKLTDHLSYYWDDIDYFSTEELTINATQDSLIRSFPFYFNHRTKPLQNQLELTYDVNTSKIQHKLLAGYSVSILDRKTYRGDIFGPGKNTTVAINNPILNQGFLGYRDTNFQGKDETVHGLYLQDWLNLGNHWKALIGLRYDIFRGTYYTDQVDEGRNVTEKGERTDIPSSAFTYRAGLVYQPLSNVSFYSGYSTYFKPSRTITGDGEVFDPEKGFQAELGSRINLNSVMKLTVSGYYIKKKNIVEGLGGGVYRQIGVADSKGVELEIIANPVDGLQLTAGYAFNKAKVRGYDNNDDNPIAGNDIAYAPDHLANVWANYQIQRGVLKGAGLSAGFSYTGENYTNSNNAYLLEGYYTLDGSVFYNYGNGQIRLNVNNITDQAYYHDAIYGNQFFPGATRNFLVTVAYNIK